MARFWLGRLGFSSISGNLRDRLQSRTRRKHPDRGRPLGFESLESRDLLTVASAPFLPASEYFVTPGTFLTQPNSADPLEIAIGYLTTDATELGLRAGKDANYQITDQYVSPLSGTTHLYFNQTYNGLSVENANININIAADGRVINAGGGFVGGLDSHSAVSLKPLLTPSEAFASLAGEFGWTLTVAPNVVRATDDLAQSTVLGSSGISLEDIPAQLHYVPSAEGGVELSWKLNVQTTDREHWYDASVAADDGELVFVSDWVDDLNSYNVFPIPVENPDDGSRVLVVDPADSTASPFGWHDTDGVVGAEFTDTRGNNVSAQEDANANNSGGFRPDGGASLDFDFTLDLGLPAASNEPAAITNLFYWNNTLHDIFFQYGFDEASGNFQVTNYSGQGAGGDPVQADALDGSGVNNANFATPPDGFDPRMQMFLWDLTTPSRDGDFDNVIITHEYGHGVSNRLTGGPGNSNALNAAQSGGMGEGWGDWWGLMLTQKPSDGQFDSSTVGTYLLGESTNGPGIRNFPYNFDMAVNPQTYADIGSTNQPHGVGEIWAQTLWDMNWLLINGDGGDIPAQGFDPDLYNGTGGNNVALQLVMDGLKLQPANPSFLDARDAILQADLVSTGGANHLAIWTAFARRGMGASASDGGSASSVNVLEAFDLPATSAGVVEFNAESYEVGDSIQITLADLNLIGAGSQNVTLSSTGGDTETIALSEIGGGIFEGTVATAASFTLGNGVLEIAANDTITVTYNDADDGSGSPAIATDVANIVLLVDIFSQDFESGLGGNEYIYGAFTINNSNVLLNNGTMMLGHPTTYGDNEYSSYQFTVSLAGYTNAKLEFDYAAQIEDYWDGFNVQASVGPISAPLDLITPISGLPYDAASGQRPLIGTTAYDGGGAIDTGTAVFDLSAFAGQTVNIRLQFGSDSSVTRAGIDIDNLRLRGTPSVLLAAPDPGTAGAVNSFEVSGATPGGTVAYVFGFIPGSTDWPVGNPLGTVDIYNPRFLGTAIANGNGVATLNRFFFPGVANIPFPFLFQAIDIATGTSTNRISHTFASPLMGVDGLIAGSQLSRLTGAGHTLAGSPVDYSDPIVVTASNPPARHLTPVATRPQAASRSQVHDEIFAVEEDYGHVLVEKLLEDLL